MGAPPQHTNRLAESTSPYLLQHAHNPVDWHPWGEEALGPAHGGVPLVHERDLQGRDGERCVG